MFAIIAATWDAVRGAANVGRTRALEPWMHELTGAKHWVLTNSGRSALSVALMALREWYPDRDEVVIPAYTSYSVPAAVVRAGLRVRLCDVELETLGISPKALDRALTSKSLCVVPHHLYGMPCAIESISEISRDHEIPLVEDVAQGMGSRYVGLPLGSFGTASTFSLSRGKTLPAAGGGLIGTNDEAFAYQCRQILQARGPRDQGQRFGIGSVLETALMGVFIHPSLYWLPASLPFLKLGQSIYDPDFEIRLMSQFQETLASRLFSGLDEILRVRQNNAVRLRRALSEFPGLYIVRPALEDEQSGCLRLAILVNDPARRNRILRQLKEEGLGATDGYTLPLSDIAELRPNLSDPGSRFPVARQISQQLITLPTHPHVTEDDVGRIVEVFRQCTHKLH